MTSSPAPVLSRQAWIMIAASAAIVTLAMGVRQSFGLYLTPMVMDLGISRQTFGFVLALQNLLFGAVQPFVGAYADKHGAGRVLLIGTAMYAAGMVITAYATNALGIGIGFGALVGMAMSGCTFVVTMGAVGKIVPPHKRTLAFGIITAGGSLGQFFVVPLAQALIDAIGWQNSLTALAAMLLLIVPLAFGLMTRRGAVAASRPEGLPLGQALKQAFADHSWWLLFGGYFVCGFHVAFVGIHFPAYITDQGLPASVGATGLALIGLFNILGSWMWGAWGGKYSKKHLLAVLYALRGVAIIVFLMVPLTSASALVFTAAFGFLWLGTVPLTNGLVAQIYGLRNLSALTGLVFFGHQIGAFLGAWLAGLIFDATGSYQLVWYIAIALGFIAAVANLPIRQTPPAPQPAHA
ncbi:MFS transporter [uncultured Brevundimonas sp.]|uniref:MFS transporter n=1 Tax=uncultured Brevundimonas sp. TaxID=213418 RepID=UPI002603FEE2|nr:MFS transporter [uncultured Brevundimonas sp.]